LVVTEEVVVREYDDAMDLRPYHGCVIFSELVDNGGGMAAGELQ
jgi:hypothetical protein